MRRRAKGADGGSANLLSRGAEVDYQGPIELGTFIKEDLAKWADVVKKANIKLEE